jgi:hypothetical protein
MPSPEGDPAFEAQFNGDDDDDEYLINDGLDFSTL